MGNHLRKVILNTATIGMLLLALNIIFHPPQWVRNAGTIGFIAYSFYALLLKRPPYRPFRFDPPKQPKNEAQVTEQQDETAVAIAHLKRQVEFQRQQSIQVYDSQWVSIKTERSGRSLKIAWSLSFDMPYGHTLIGFRKTDGFSANQFELASNGTLVVESQDDGEVVEFLTAGETYFYTFLVRSRSWLSGERYSRASRFQAAIITEGETAPIEEMIRRLEEKDHVIETPDPDKEHVSKALKELGSYRQFDAAIEAAKQEAIAEVEKGNYSEDEKREKISRLRDQVALIREKYEQ